jgi:arylsulfatase A-like enzyme
MNFLTAKRRPNILLITTDTQRCDTLSCMGNPHAVSPHIDRLAREGVLFDNAHTSSAVCSPTRCSLMTGLHTPIHGCLENGMSRLEHFPLFPELLKAEGYTTIMVGKTHFGSTREAFDVLYNLNSRVGDKKNFYEKYLNEHGMELPVSHPHSIPEEHYLETLLVNLTIQEIDKAVEEDRGPFFAFCSMDAPHGPIIPPGNWGHVYDDLPLPEINYTDGEVFRHPVHLRRLLDMLGHEAEITEQLKDIHDPVSELRKTIDHERRLYYGFAAYCDAQVGRLMDYLDRRGLRENTLVIFTSDHGKEYFDHGIDDKHNYYDNSWRIPLIMSMPGTLPAGERRDFAVWNDLTTTILAAAGIESQTMQGFDLFTPLTEGKPSPRLCAVGTLYKSAAVATKRWKLEYYFEEGRGRMFDRLQDPREQTDLYDNEKVAAIRNELVTALLTWRSDISDLQSVIGGTLGGGGHVSRAIAPYTKAMRGTDPEQRLNDWSERIDAMS